MSEPHDNRSDSLKRLAVVALLGCLALLVGLSGWLAASRIYQVDECQNVFVARLLATGQAQNAFTGVTLFLAPFAWLGSTATDSVELFQTARLFTWILLWVNVILLAVATGEKLRSRRGLLALTGAATLAPLWDYGFEIRHDNLLLTGLLLLWCSVRIVPRGATSYCLAGALTVALEFIAFKAFVYTIPISTLAIIAPSSHHRAPRGKLLLAWTAGGLGALLLVRLGYGMAGWWEIYTRDLVGISAVAIRGDRFGPWLALSRLVSQMPLLVPISMAGLVAIGIDVSRDYRRKRFPGWDGALPEALLLLVSVGALIVNPAPYPYNLVNVAPFVFLFSWRCATFFVKRVHAEGLVTIAVLVVIAGHVIPFCAATLRHFKMTNARQHELMRLAEDLTEAGKDPVYDGIGMVPTRSSIHYQWFLHSSNVESLVTGSGLRVRDMLAARPAAVLIPSYRTDWLSRDDHAFIRERYVPLSDDFFVLGSLLPPGGGSVQIVHPGRYRITLAEEIDVEGLHGQARAQANLLGSNGNWTVLNAVLNGAPMTSNVVELSAGWHRLECAATCQPAIIWLGPRLNEMPRLEPSDHRLLFVNWY